MLRHSGVFTAASFVRIEPVKMSCNYRNWNGKSQNSTNGASGSDQFSDRSERYLVSVSDRRHGDDRPPEAIRNAVYLRLSLIEFGVVDGARENKKPYNKSDEEQPETFETRPERQQKDLLKTTLRMFRVTSNACQVPCKW